MGKKGKGRQCGGFDSKLMRGAFVKEIQEQVQKHRHYNSRQHADRARTQRQEAKQRPRIISLTPLKYALRERQSYEQYERLQRRRREGFVPQNRSSIAALKEVDKLWRVAHPGWILYHELERNDLDNMGASDVTLEKYPDFPSDDFRRNLDLEIHESRTMNNDTSSLCRSLVSQSLHVLADHLPKYLEAMGAQELNSVLAMLPAETLSVLSVLVSSKLRINNELAMVLGKHSHIRRLALHVAPGGDDGYEEDDEQGTITDEGLRNLLSFDAPPPIIKCDGRFDDEDDDSWNEERLEHILFGSPTLSLERLELVHCRSLSADAVVEFFENVGLGLTHLSLAGSLSSIVGPVVLERLFLRALCPSLKVLDLSRCVWLTSDVLRCIRQAYRSSKHGSELLIYCKGCSVSVSAVLVRNDPNYWLDASEDLEHRLQSEW